MKISKGQHIPDFEFMNHKSERNVFSQVLEESKKTVLLFLRYYGCPVCQLDIREYRNRYKEFQNKNMQVFIVLQSTPENITKEPIDLPFDIICDPEMKLYKEFEIIEAKSTLKLMSFGLFRKAIQVKKLGITHGEYEGIETQLPATFVLDQKGLVLFSRYGKNITDIPTIDSLLKM